MLVANNDNGCEGDDCDRKWLEVVVVAPMVLGALVYAAGALVGMDWRT